MIRRKTLNRKQDQGLNENQIIELLHGLCFAGDSGFENETHMRNAYLRHKDFLFTLQGAREFDRFEFGSRPYAWWQFEDLPEKRRIVKYYESPASVSVGPPMPIRESEYEFLKRNNLLWEGEEEKYRAAQAIHTRFSA